MSISPTMQCCIETLLQGCCVKCRTKEGEQECQIHNDEEFQESWQKKVVYKSIRVLLVEQIQGRVA